MANLLPPVGTTRLLELVSPYVPDDFILNLCPRLSTLILTRENSD